jgi:cation diffusion facilitator family transporter
MSLSTLERNTFIGLVASLLLAATKLTAGLMGHSSALVADAVESFADSLGSILVWKALRVAARPPDASHPYGYGKAEALASLAVGSILVIAACLIVIEAFHEIVIPHAAPAPWTLVVLITVVAIKELLFRVVMSGASEFDSDAARADAWHHRADAITSVAALIGVTLAVWGPRWFGIPGFVLADEAAAILASGIILITASQLIRPALQELLDAASHEMATKVAQVAAQVEGVVQVEKTFVRKSGPGYHVDMHLHVNPDLPIRTAHALAGRVKAAIKDQIPNVTGVLIHVEPSEDAPGGA